MKFSAHFGTLALLLLNQNFVIFHLNGVLTMAQVGVKSSGLISKVILSHFWPLSKQTEKHWILKWNVKSQIFLLILILYYLTKPNIVIKQDEIVIFKNLTFSGKFSRLWLRARALKIEVHIWALRPIWNFIFGISFSNIV